jgi:UDP-N-acetyl-D-mannosaminuronic acid dehydrogenase
MRTKITVFGMGYVGIPCAALLADVENFHVTGIQRRSKRSGWKIDCLNNGKSPFKGNEPGLDELISRVVNKEKFVVTDDPAVCSDSDYILIDVQTPTDDIHYPKYESLEEVSHQISQYMTRNH